MTKARKLTTYMLFGMVRVVLKEEEIKSNNKYMTFFALSLKRGETEMAKTIKAIFSKGMIKPLEKIKIPEGKEITITIMDISEESAETAFKRAAGKWKRTINTDELIANIYTDRLILSRPEIKL